MIFEIQMSAKAYLDNFSNKIRGTYICYRNTVQIDNGEPAYLDRVDFLQPRLEGGLEIIQPVLVRMVTMSALKAANGGEAAGTEYTCDIHVKCEINNGLFTTSLGDIVFNQTWPAHIANYFEDYILKPSFATSAPVQLPIGLLAGTAGLPPDTIPVSGINVTEGKSAVVIRVEYAAAPNMQAWANFHNGKTIDRLPSGGQDNFCIFIDVASLMEKTEQDLRNNLSGQMNVNSISCWWQPNSTGGVIHTSVDATLVDICEGPLNIGAVDVDVEITAQTALSVILPTIPPKVPPKVPVVRPKVLGMHTTFDWDADNWDVARCGALMSLETMLKGISEFFWKGPMPAMISSAVSIGILIAIGPIVANHSVTLPPKENCVNGEKNQHCELDLTVKGPSGTVEFNTAKGTNEGLLLLGKMPHDRLVSRPVIDSINLLPLAPKVQGTCSNQYIAGSGGVVIRYRLSENLTKMVPVEICNCYVMDGAPYQPLIHPDSISVEYALESGKTPTQPCRIFFQTNAGTCIFDLGMPPQWTAEVEKAMKLQMETAKHLCDKSNTTWADRLGQAILKYKDWRKPVEKDKEVVLWKVVLSGGQDGDLIKLSAGAKPMMEFIVTKGVAELGVILPLADSDISLAIERKTKMAAKESLQAIGTLLKPQGTFDVGFIPSQINFIKGTNGLNLEVTDGRRRAVYATRDIAFLSTLKKWQAGDLLLPSKKALQPMRIGKLIFDQKDGVLSIRPTTEGRPVATVKGVPEEMNVSEVPSAGHKEAFLLWSEKGGELRFGPDAQVLARFQRTPWLAGFTQRGNLVAKADGSAITLYEISGLFREQLGVTTPTA